jgi:hypothetical protein
MQGQRAAGRQGSGSCARGCGGVAIGGEDGAGVAEWESNGCRRGGQPDGGQIAAQPGIAGSDEAQVRSTE